MSLQRPIHDIRQQQLLRRHKTPMTRLQSNWHVELLCLTATLLICTLRPGPQYMLIMTVERCSNAGLDAHLYLDARVEDETLKNVVLHSVATALASMVLPVPGGPNMSTPCTVE